MWFTAKNIDFVDDSGPYPQDTVPRTVRFTKCKCPSNEHRVGIPRRSACASFQGGREM
jgi:hypothetical protein